MLKRYTDNYWQKVQPCLPQDGCWYDICWTPSKHRTETTEYQRHPNFSAVPAEKEGKWPDQQSRIGQKTTPGYPDAENVISADKVYKTTPKPNQNPTVMNSIISKSSVSPYILEGMHCEPLKLLYWPKNNRKRGFSRLRIMQWFLSNDPNNSARGLTKFLWYLGKGYEPFNSLRLNQTENIMNNMHRSWIKRERQSTAVNSQINRPEASCTKLTYLGKFDFT